MAVVVTETTVVDAVVKDGGSCTVYRCCPRPREISVFHCPRCTCRIHGKSTRPRRRCNRRRLRKNCRLRTDTRCCRSNYSGDGFRTGFCHYSR